MGPQKETGNDPHRTSGHVCARQPAATGQWPQFLFTLPDLHYPDRLNPDRLNCVSEFVDKWVESGQGGRIAVIAPQETLIYAQLAERINRVANVLTRDLGLVPGNRVLLRAPNTPTMIAAYLAVMKAGGVTVASMPLLRAEELSYVVRKAKIRLALCDARLDEAPRMDHVEGAYNVR